jgi:hypothetical protein
MDHDHAPLSALPGLDADYSFGRPKLYLTPRELARLTLVRSRLGDTRHEREAELQSGRGGGGSGEGSHRRVSAADASGADAQAGPLRGISAAAAPAAEAQAGPAGANLQTTDELEDRQAP